MPHGLLSSISTLRRALIRAPCEPRRLSRVSTPRFPLDPRVRAGDTVVMAMSGGVDSSVSLRLLAEHDLALSAVFMRNWSSDASDDLQGCEWEKDWEDVQRVCKMLDVPCSMIDLSRDYWVRVFEPALADWEEGITPNPDVSCNREIKFGALMDRSLTSPKSFLATGHYARVDQTPEGEARLLRALDPKKDQSYFLSSVPEEKLAKALFPIGHLHKTEVKRLALEYQLPTAERKESMGVCFIDREGHFDRFLGQYISPQPGPVMLLNGETVGSHDGLWTYTIGERHRMAGRVGHKEKWYVAGKDRTKNALVIVPGSDHPALCTSTFLSLRWNWVSSKQPPAEVDGPEGLRVDVKIRSASKSSPARLRRSITSPDAFEITFDEARAMNVVTPGQVAVAYVGDWCLGSGVIAEPKESLIVPDIKAS